MFNQVILIGNLGSDVESRYTPSGVMVANFRMAVNKTWIGQDGQRQEKVTWWRVSCWRKTAEVVSQYLTKGQRVLVVGEDVEARPYLNKAGEPAASLEITAVTIKFLSAKGEGTPAATTPADQKPPESLTELEEIPF